MADHFAVFETHLRKRGRRWTWYLCTADGRLLIQSSEASRPAARYRANRALFQMLLGAGAGSVRLCESDKSRRRLGRSRSDS